MIRIAITVVLLFSLQGHQQSPPDKRRTPDKPPPRRSLEVENILSDARSLPAEFAIDILLRIAASNSVDKKWKEQILIEAFTLTANVQNELRLKSIPGIPVDSRINYKSYAFALSLDRLSLRSKIIGQMLSINKREALRMLDEVSPKLRFNGLSCSDQLAYDVAEFYRMLANITQAVHDEKSVQQGERVQFLLPYAQAMSSPSQVAPLARMIVSLRLTNRELFILSQAFAAALKQISADDRSFTAALTQDKTATHVFELTQHLKNEGGMDNEVASALRTYLAKHLSGNRCKDNVQPNETELPRHIKEINYYFPNNPFNVDDLRPAKVEEGSATAEYFESNGARKLSLDFKELRGYDDDDPSTKEPKTSAAWQERMLDYLRQLEAWNSRGEASTIDHFHQKCVLYFALAQIAPPGEAGDQVMISYINFLNQPAAFKETRIEWLLHAKELLGLVIEKKGDERSRLLESLLYSKSSVLQTYARLSKANIR